MNIEQWRDYRNKSVVSEQGDLALVAMIEISDLKTVDLVPGQWKANTIHETGLILKAEKEDRILINGQVVDGEVEILTDQTIVTFADGKTAMATSQPESNHLLAIWDTSIEKVQKFKKIDVFDESKEWIVKGKWKEVKEQAFAFEHTSDTNRKRIHVSQGLIEISFGNSKYNLRPFDSEGTMIVIFRDATSGVETYEMGRMVIVQMGKTSDEVILDFNQAFLPPCAFSPYFNCPMPPFSNRIKEKILAGEKSLIISE